jgi:hypothetical protein
MPDASSSRPADPAGPPSGAAPPITSYAHLDRRQRIATVAGLMLTLLLAAMDQTIVGTAMPRVVANLDGFDRYPWVTRCRCSRSSRTSTAASGCTCRG